MKALISALNRFHGVLTPEDDVTLMVIKIGELGDRKVYPI